MYICFGNSTTPLSRTVFFNFQAASGTGLAFVIFTQAIVEFGPSAPFWSIIFFMMLLSLGMGSEFGTIEGVTASIYDLEPFPFVRKKWLVSGKIAKRDLAEPLLLLKYHN